MKLQDEYPVPIESNRAGAMISISNCIRTLYNTLLTCKIAYDLRGGELESFVFEDGLSSAEHVARAYNEDNYGLIFSARQDTITIRPDPAIWNVKRIKQLLDNEERYRNVIAALANNDYEYVAEAITEHNEKEMNRREETMQRIIDNNREHS